MSEIEFKYCKSCNQKLPIAAFEFNQYGKDNARIHRSECTECRKKAKKFPTIPAGTRREYLIHNPKPKIGSNFTCPICLRTTVIEKERDTNLDHDHNTGEIRGFICNRCNTGLGNLRDDISILQRAIRWISRKLHL